MKNFQNVMFYSRKCNAKTLQYDESCFTVLSDRNISLWKQYTECDGCDDIKAGDITQGKDSYIVKTIWPLRYDIKDGDERSICNGTFTFKEYGRYRMNITSKGCSDITVVDQPDEALLPFLIAVVIALALATLWYLVKGVYKRLAQTELFIQLFRRGEAGAELLGAPGVNGSPTRRTSTRLLSADVFRGFTISLMVLVNYGGGGYKGLTHAPWNGLTVADLVFPWFAWLMGVSVCLSLHTRLRTAMTRWKAFLQVLRRSAILICIGIVLGSTGRTIEELRIPGVLQRLGMVYLIVGGLECFAMNASHNYMPGTALLRDFRSTWKQWGVTVILVAVHVGVSLGLETPDCPRGYLGPGGLHNHSSAFNCTGGVAGYIDREVFGDSHIYKKGTFRHLYKPTIAFDPEGILGTLTCALVVQLGAQAARILLAYTHARARVVRWLLWGLITGLAAGGLCSFSKNGGPIPINKSLWSLSYCLAASSTAFIIQALLYLAVDMYAVWGGRPFYYAGRNALLLYIGQDLMKDRFPFEWKIRHPSHLHLLAMNCLAVILWMAIAVFLHRKKVILTI